MAIQAGRHHLGTDRGRLTLVTLRDGLAAQVGHDLTIELTRWSGELTLGDDLVPVGLELRLDMGSLVIREGHGGLKPLTDRDKREIAVTARKVLTADRHPEATYQATDFKPGGAGGGTVTGTLTLAGRSRPLTLAVSQGGPGQYEVTATIAQSDFGIKPYSAFLGSLKVRDAVDLRAEISLPDADADATAHGSQDSAAGAGA